VTVEGFYDWPESELRHLQQELPSTHEKSEYNSRNNKLLHT